MGQVVQFPRALKRVARPEDNDFEDTCIYLIANGAGHIKIGISANPRSRMAALQASNATRLRLLHKTNPFPRRQALCVERVLHRHLHEFAMGHEWFAVTKAQALDALIAVGPELREMIRQGTFGR